MVDQNRALIDLAEDGQARFWKLSFNELTSPERIFRLVWELEGEVNNGGFHQYFFNSSGDIAMFTPSALRIIGAEAAASIVDRALSVFGNGGPSPDRDTRGDQLDALGDGGVEALDALTSEFYTYPDDLTALLHKFVSTHRTEIAGVPAAF